MNIHFKRASEASTTRVVTPRRPIRLITRRRGLAVAASVLVLAAGLLAGCGAAGSSAASSTASSASDSGKVKVVASFYPMADFAQKIGGDHVEVTNLVPAGTEPHEWEPAPKDVAAIQDASVFVYNGASMEGWVDDALSSIDSSKVTVVEASKGLDLLPGEDDHEHEGEGEASEDSHEEAEYNPHVWLYPLDAKKELENIKDGLVKADPDHKADYEANYEAYAAKFDQLDQDYKEQISAAKGKTIVVSHDAYGYLAKAYGLTTKAIAGMDAEGEPDAKTMAQIIDFVKANNVKVIFSEDLVSPKVAQQIADSTGAECKVLNPLEGLTDEQLKAGEDYISVMETNLKEIVSALNEE